MDPTRPALTPEEEEADRALREARTRFVAGFPSRFLAMRTLLDGAAADSSATLDQLRNAAHKLAGLSGILGFPTVSKYASALERALDEPSYDPTTAGAVLNDLANGFTRDLSTAAPSWAQQAAPAAQSAQILLVEDDEEQRQIAAAGLRAAGYRVATAASGQEALDIARLEVPDLILLDVDLPGLDGMAVCRQIKLDKRLSRVPVVFCTARAGLIDRMAGLTLGADDYVTKPYAPGELLIRIKRLVARPVPATAPAASAEIDGLLSYDRFVIVAHELLAHEPASLLLVRTAAADLAGLAARCAAELRRRDVLAQLSDTHLVMLTPGLSMATARATLQAIVDRPPRFAAVALGAADPAPADGARQLDAMLERADLALAADRVARSGSLPGTAPVLLAEDDPDVLHIVDARLRAAGYRTVLALDGQQALDAVERESPAVLVLDLMMPKVTGFDVLRRLRERTGPRPKTIVVSARGRDEDVVRAFDLGADDYLTKPFNPDELLARVARLTR